MGVSCLGGTCSGDNCPKWQLSGGNCPRWQLSGDNSLGTIFPGVVVQGGVSLFPNHLVNKQRLNHSAKLVACSFAN